MGILRRLLGGYGGSAGALGLVGLALYELSVENYAAALRALAGALGIAGVATKAADPPAQDSESNNKKSAW